MRAECSTPPEQRARPWQSAQLVAATFTEAIAAANEVVATPGGRSVDLVLSELATAVLRDRNLRVAAAALTRPRVVKAVRAAFATQASPGLPALRQVVVDYLRGEQIRSRVGPDADVEAAASLFTSALHDALLDHRRVAGVTIEFDRLARVLVEGLASQRKTGHPVTAY